jgi:hypothetical protein
MKAVCLRERSDSKAAAIRLMARGFQWVRKGWLGSNRFGSPPDSKTWGLAALDPSHPMFVFIVDLDFFAQ